MQMIQELQLILDLSIAKTKKMVAVLRKSLDLKSAVETNVLGKIQELQETLSDFYHVENIGFTDSLGNIIMKDLVYIKDVSEFIMMLINERKLDPFETLVRVSVDGGGSFMKIIVNVFDVHEKRNEHLDSGVQKCQILAITEDISETNANLRLILEKLRLQDLDYKIAFDLKCGNALFGLSAHGGKFACLWCEGTSTMCPGHLRTLGSLDVHYKDYKDGGFKRNRMQDYKNVVNERLLYLDEDPNVLLEHLVPPPELHLLIGFVSLLGTLLMDLWPEFDSWLKSKNIMQRGYQGRGWDGNNSNKILKFLDGLEEEILKSCPQFIPIVQCLKDFRKVKEACFGKNLDPCLRNLMERLKNSFLCAQDVAIGNGKNLSITWKVHILMCHVVPFVEFHNCGMSRFAEQCGESIHAKFKPTWARYKRSEGHSEHQDKLKKAVIDFGGRRIT